MPYASFWHLFIMTSAPVRSNPVLQVETQVVGFFCTEMLLFLAANTASECSLNISSNEELTLKCFVCLFVCLLAVREVLIVTEVEGWKLSIRFGIPSHDICNLSLIKPFILPLSIWNHDFCILFDALSKWTIRHDYLSSLNMRMGPSKLNFKKI